MGESDSEEMTDLADADGGIAYSPPECRPSKAVIIARCMTQSKGARSRRTQLRPHRQINRTVSAALMLALLNLSAVLPTSVLGETHRGVPTAFQLRGMSKCKDTWMERKQLDVNGERQEWDEHQEEQQREQTEEAQEQERSPSTGVSQIGTPACG